MIEFEASSRSSMRIGLALSFVVGIASLPRDAQAQAGPCGSLGNLYSLSTTADGSQSLWLSRTTAGSAFALDATVSSTRVDTWIGSGLHISASPFVAVGPAGAHTLSEISGDTSGSGCAIATTNQLARPSQTLPPVPGGGSGGGGQPITESAIIGFSPTLLGHWSITERLSRRSLGPYGVEELGNSATDEDSFAWFDTSFSYANNDQYSRDGSDSSAQLIFGLDVWSDDVLQVGIAAGLDAANSNSFNNTVSADINSYFVGPYLGWRPDNSTLVDVWLGYANREVTNRIGTFGSSFDADRFFVDANLTRRLNRGNLSIFPKLGVFYAQDDMPDHQYTDGVTAFNVASNDAETLIARVAVDVWVDPLAGSNGVQWLPFFGAGIDWYAERPGDGLVLGNDLEIESVGDVVGSLSAGTDLLTNNGGRWTTSILYDGIGLSGYNEVEIEFAYNFEF